MNPIPIGEIDAKPNTLNTHHCGRVPARDATELPRETLQTPPVTQPNIQPEQR
jgi:hypothetical protein